MEDLALLIFVRSGKLTTRMNDKDARVASQDLLTYRT